MSQNDLYLWFEEVTSQNYPKIYSLVKRKKISIYEIPIVVYCAHSECNAGYQGGIELQKKGFVNIMDYKEGMKGYLEKIVK